MQAVVESGQLVSLEPENTRIAVDLDAQERNARRSFSGAMGTPTASHTPWIIVRLYWHMLLCGGPGRW